MKIGEVSKELGIPSATLRYYEQIGLLEDIKKEHGIREYQEEDIERLNFIICMKKAGFKLEDIVGQKLKIHGTKTANAERTILLSLDFINYLKNGCSKNLDELYFNLQPNAYYHKLKRLYKRLNFPSSLNLHSLRHTCSANLHYLGVPDKRRQQILGHSSIVITNNIYTELEPEITSKNIKNLYMSYYYSDFD